MLNRTKAIIIDDEPAAIKKLEIELARAGINVLASSSSPLQTTKIIKDKNPDIVFLDVQMPQKSGIEVLKDIAESDLKCTVIMVTAHRDFMLDAFRNAAFDYLLKPVCSIELKKVVQRFFERKDKGFEKEKVAALLNQLNKKIKIPSVYETHFLNVDQIFYMHANGKYTDIHLTNDKQILTSINLGAVDELLPKGEFLRISKSTIINLSYLTKISRKSKVCSILVNNNEIKLRYSKLYLNKLEQLV